MPDLMEIHATKLTFKAKNLGIDVVLHPAGSGFLQVTFDGMDVYVDDCRALTMRDSRLWFDDSRSWLPPATTRWRRSSTTRRCSFARSTGLHPRLEPVRLRRVHAAALRLANLVLGGAGLFALHEDARRRQRRVYQHHAGRWLLLLR
jgi:hypothetical protein